MATLKQSKNILRRSSLVKLSHRSTSRDIKIVAEGDSWFDYPFMKDIIDHLRNRGYAIYKESHFGDTLEDMVYGTKIRKRDNKNLGSANWKKTHDAIKKYNPRFVLFSACGNDVIGASLDFYINHHKSGLTHIRNDVFEYMLNKFMKKGIEDFCKAVWNIKNDIHIIMDGYDYGVPTGKSFHHIRGPWILPTFKAKYINDKSEMKRIIKFLVDKFNKMLKDLDNKHKNFHHIKLSGMFPNEHDWDNEIHLKAAGFKKVSELYHKSICRILGYDPLK